MYTDLCLITANSSITKDACNFFLNMTQSNLYGDYHALLVAPNSLKNRILDFIDKEISKGENGYIFMKMNSLSDINVIDKLVEASSAGVQIQLVIRGICCLLPNIPSKTDNIQVHSIVGRYLEHSRIYIFGKGTDEVIYISSADMMTRNTQNRVEIAAPIYDKDIKEQIHHIVDSIWKDNVKARSMANDGTYHIINYNFNSSWDSQEEFMKEAKEKATEGKETHPSFFSKFMKLFA